MSTHHVPAWKRLGLKLKYANENNSRTSLISSDGGNDGNREKEATPRIINGSTNQSSQLTRSHHSDEILTKLNGGGKDTFPHTNGNNNLKRKKSVSFTPDTKVEDGDSAQTIQYWIPESAQTAEKHYTVSNKSSSEDSSEHVRRAKRPKGEKDLSQRPCKASAALDYLDQFQNSRSSWKFNKNHETWVLKHALLVNSLPRSYDLALASYLKGLKSMDARRRLIEQSREALKAVNGSLADDAESRVQFIRMLNADRTSKSYDKEELGWLEGIERSRLIFWAFDESTQSRLKDNQPGSQVQVQRKKRKSRTVDINIELSSSSDSDSDDDTSSSDTNTQNEVGMPSNASSGTLSDTTSDASSDTSSSTLSSAESE